MNGFFRFVYRLFNSFLFFFFPVEISGLENLPAHGALLCPNHSSNWDPILLVLKLPIDYRIHVMAKDSLFRNPILAWILRKLGAFPVARGSSDIHAVKTAIQAIKSGDNLLIFPEGTVVEKGIGKKSGQPARAKGGVAMIGIRTGAVMIPVFLDGRKRLFHKTRIIIGKPYHPVYTGRHGTAEEMQAIADDILKEAYALGGTTACQL
jgi:1-acyl-sn-glycerol-3-phosphate acyltransferase